MLTCKELTELVTEYTEGTMPLVKRVQLHIHLAMCSHCRRYLRQLKATRAALGSLPSEPMPREMKNELLKRLGPMAAKANETRSNDPVSEN